MILRMALVLALALVLLARVVVTAQLPHLFMVLVDGEHMVIKLAS